MTIIRGPQPRENFQILPNATARDRRLSFRARGLLALMLSYPPDWQFNRDWLAAQTDGEGVTAVRTALQELEKHGYLVRRRIRVDGRFAWVQKVYRFPQGELADQSMGGLSANENSADGFPPSTEEGYEDLQEVVVARPHDVRGDDKPEATSWREEDRQRFRDLIGSDRVSSDGSRWTEGTFTTDAVYDAMYKLRKHRWPGKRLEAIAGNQGVADWLYGEGLEAA